MSGELSDTGPDSTAFKRGGVAHRRRADDGEPPSVAVARAIAAVRDESPTATTTQLYDHVDPDALDALFDGRGRGDGVLTVQFRIDGYTVEVAGGGDITVRE